MAAMAMVFGLRCLVVALFMPFSTADKLLNFSGATDQAASIFKPRALAKIVILGGMAIELFCSLALITGWHDRLGAAILAGYCVITALLFKQFWAPGDFWSNPAGKARTAFWDFWKNLALAAAIMLIAVGADGRGLSAFVADPLSSTQPYRGSQP